MRENGKMICNMERVSKLGTIAASTMANMFMGKNKALAPILGLIIRSTRGNGMITKFVEK